MDLDALAESARNRGLKLVRSRVRTAGKRGFGKVGLTDSSGKPLFGMEDKGPSANPEDVQTYLRKLDAGGWEASFGQVDKKASKKKPRAPANDVEPR